jgi:hypothetical protein
MKLDPDNDEHQCYYLGYLVEKCSEALAKYHEKTNEKPPRKTKTKHRA